MKVHFLVEGRSEAVFFDAWAPRLLKGHEIRTHPHQGKGSLPAEGMALDPRRRGLLDQLPAKLRGFAASKERANERVVVVVDADDEDCVELRRSLDAVVTKMEEPPVVLFRIAIEELEAFYLSDQRALRAAFPEADLAKARDYEPDSICGTAELFGRIVADGGLNKVSWAEAMAPKLTTSRARTRSPSFRRLITGLLTLVGGSAAGRSKRRSPTAKRNPRTASKPKRGAKR